MLKKRLVTLGSAALLALSSNVIAAKDPIKFGLTLDYTKAYVFATPSFGQAMEDYVKYINMKGGVDGHPIELLNSDHGNEPQRGIEAYERKKREGAIAFEHLSTPVSKAVLPKANKDKTVMFQMLTGRADAADGNVFPYIFPVSPTYWAMAANMIQYIADNAKDIKDTKVAFTYLDYPFGQEPIPIFKALSEKLGFKLKLFPIALPGTDQSGVWSSIRRFKPDHVISWSFAQLHNIAMTEMKRNRIPVDKYMSVVWMSKNDLKSMGYENAKGVKRVEGVVTGTDNALIQDILKTLYDAGKGSGPRENVGLLYYMAAFTEAVTVVEGMRLGLEKFGAPLTSEKLKKGLESLKGFDANGLMAPITITASDHQGGGKTRIAEWDGSKWVPKSEWQSAYSDLIWKVIKEHSAKYASDTK